MSTLMETSDRSMPRLTGAEAAALAGQIAGLAAAGLPLPGGLRAMAQELPAGGLRLVLLDLAARLELGVPVETALEEMGPRLPEHLRGLVRAGVESGRLGEILAQYVRYHSLANQLRLKAVTSLVYPAALFTIFALVFSFMMLGIVPKFKRIFMDFGIELPHLTRSVLELSDWSVECWPWLLWGAVVAVPVGWLAGRVFINPPGRQRWLYRTPLVGTLWRWTNLAQFVRLLGMLLESQLPLPAALRLAGTGVRDAEVADAAAAMAREVEAGQSLTESATRKSRFPGGVAQSLQWGESSQALAESLRTAAEMLEGRAMLHAEFVFRVAPPLMMILIVLLLGYVVVALFLPLLNIMTQISG